MIDNGNIATDIVFPSGRTPMDAQTTFEQGQGRASDGPTPHAIFGASGASIWMNCLGMFRFVERAKKDGAVPVQDTGSFYAAEGTAAHDQGERALAEIFNQGDRSKPGITLRTYDEALLPTGMTIDDPNEFAECVSLYVQECVKEADAFHDTEGLGYVGIENTYSLNALYELFGDFLTNDPKTLARDYPLFGTGDFAAGGPVRRGAPGLWDACVIDYKHGAGVPVDAKGNPQLKYYALGLLLHLEKTHRVRLSDVGGKIVQPRAAHADGSKVRLASWTRAELFEFGFELVQAVDRAVSAKGATDELNPGTHCRFCKGAAAPCPALAKRARQMAKEVFTDLDEEPLPDKDATESAAKSLSPEDMAKALRQIESLQHWIKSVQNAASHRVKHGQHIPGYKPVRGRTQRKWTDAAKVASVLENLGHDGLLEVKPPSPAQLEKKMGKNDPNLDDIFDAHLDKSEGPVTWAPEDDPRPEVKHEPVFSDLSGD